MGFLELFLISIGVSMDAFAVAICKGLSMEKINIKKALIVGLYFGFFQAIMPLIGYYFGIQFKEKIAFIDHWIALILLCYIGIDMIISSLHSSQNPCDCSLRFKNMIVLAVATSIDALAVGITLTFLQVDIIKGVVLIGIITFILSIIGVKIGNIFGAKYKSKAELAGGLILTFMGIKIFIEHTGIINSLF
jgi:putative Mn2+ efflux pump MntP